MATNVTSRNCSFIVGWHGLVASYPSSRNNPHVSQGLIDILDNDAEDVSVSLQKYFCFPATCVGVDVLNMALKYGEILFHVRPPFFLNWLIFDCGQVEANQRTAMVGLPTQMSLFPMKIPWHALLHMSRTYVNGTSPSWKQDPGRPIRNGE